MADPVVVWFRNDLRVGDHEALAEAVRQTDRVLPVYCFDPRHFAETALGLPKTGPFRAWFLVESVDELRASLQERGTDLIVRHGRPEDVLPYLVRRYGATAVHLHREVTAEETATEAAVGQALAGTGARLRYFWGHTLIHADDLPFGRDEVPDVFTTFRRAVESRWVVRPTQPAPVRLAPLPGDLDPGAVPSLAQIGVVERPMDARAALAVRGGERAALERLQAYIWDGDHLRRYKETRNGLLGPDFSSRLSAWLSLGCLSARTVYEHVRCYERERVANESTYWLVFELLWRDFFRFVARRAGDRLFYASGPARRSIAWERDAEALARWVEGTTGYPFVDANMRELNATGFMSNRGRQNVASYLAKTLKLDWRWGASYFESLLIDYDVTSNWGNWAYVAGVGHDPRNRTFNVVTQARRYDPEGTYVRYWLPELDGVPASLVHEPYRLSLREQALYGIALGQEYPWPLPDG